MAKIQAFVNEYRWLSNFAPAKVTLDGEVYPTVEHAYQAAKTLDGGIRRQVQALGSSANAKKMGKRLLIRPDWLEVRVPIMTELLRQKYAQEPYRSNLISTGSAEIIEGNYWGDVFWGVCKGRGENNLGKIIMGIRDTLLTNHNLGV